MTAGGTLLNQDKYEDIQDKKKMKVIFDIDKNEELGISLSKSE